MAKNLTAAERLFAQAQAAVKHFESEDGLARLEELKNTLIACFEAEDSDTLYQALHLAERAKNLEAVTLIEECLEYISAHQYINDGESLLTISLFAVPVFMEIHPPSELDNAYMKLNSAFQELEQSFRKMGLVRKGATVALQNYLYHPNELDALSYFDVANITVNMHAALLDWTDVSGEQLAQTGMSHNAWLPGQYPGLELRYLVGVIQDNQLTISFEPKGKDERSKLVFESRISKWQQSVHQLLPECLNFNGPIKLDVLKPELFYEAYRVGLKALLNSSLYYSIVDDLAQISTPSEAAQALIVPYGAEGELLEYYVFVYAQEKEELLLARGRRLLPFESSKEARVELVLVLRAAGIEDVVVLDELQEWTTGEDMRDGNKTNCLFLPANRTLH